MPAPTTAPKMDSWDEESDGWEDHEQSTTSRSIPPPTAAPPLPAPKVDTIEDIMKQNFAGSTITSLSKPKPTTSVSKSTPRKKKVTQDEDIFASMGLSSLPTKNKTTTTTTNSSSASSSLKQQPLSKPSTSSSLSAAVLVADEEPLDGGDKWGDDSDLDDLLDD